MAETDNFEFKPLLNLNSRTANLQNSRKNQMLRECKQVIKDLDQALKLQLQAHDITKKQLASLQKQYLQAEAKIKTLQQKLANSQKANQNIQQTLSEYKKQISQSKQKNQKLSSQNQLLQKQASNQLTQNKSLDQQINHLKQTIRTKNEKLVLAEETITLMLEQNRQLKREIVEKEDEEQWGIQELRKINSDVKNRFSAFYEEDQQNYDKNNQVSENKPPHITITPFQLTPLNKNRSVSSGVRNCQKQNMKSTAFNHTKNPQSPYSFYSKSSAKHQVKQTKLNQEIQCIKEQISNQYALVNLRQENYCKKRVDRTLTQLKQKVSHFIALKTGQMTSENEY